jgi:hypothetical protein
MPEIIYMKKSEYDKISAENLRKKFMSNPPVGYTSAEIETMAVDDILDMAYFLHEGSSDFDHPDFDEEPDTIIHLIDDYPNELDDPDIPL